MPAEIAIQKIKEGEGTDSFEVTVREGGSQSVHEVTVADEYVKKLFWDPAEKEQLIRESFSFLLERESKESILSSFDLQVIERYFPEYPEKISAKRGVS